MQKKILVVLAATAFIPSTAWAARGVYYFYRAGDRDVELFLDKQNRGNCIAAAGGKSVREKLKNIEGRGYERINIIYKKMRYPKYSDIPEGYFGESFAYVNGIKVTRRCIKENGFYWIYSVAVAK